VRAGRSGRRPDGVREVDPMFALWGLIIGVAGAIGSVLHGGLDLAETIRGSLPETSAPSIRAGWRRSG
jgi:hypothetical protein